MAKLDVKNVVRTLFWAGGEWNVVCGKLLNGRGVEWAQEGHGQNLTVGTVRLWISWRFCVDSMGFHRL